MGYETSIKAACGPSSGSDMFDRQQVTSVGVTVSTTGYTDLATMTLTTKNLGGNGSYTVVFNGYAKMNSASDDGTVILNVAGVNIPASEIMVNLQSTTKQTSLSLIYQLDNIPAATVIKVRGKVSGGTLTIYNAKLIINGVLQSIVLP